MGPEPPIFFYKAQILDVLHVLRPQKKGFRIHPKNMEDPVLYLVLYLLASPAFLFHLLMLRHFYVVCQDYHHWRELYNQLRYKMLLRFQ